jgi:hypothetical protein
MPGLYHFNCGIARPDPFLSVAVCWDFHQPERRLTTRRAGDIAPIKKKGLFKFPIRKVPPLPNTDDRHTNA